MSWKVASWKVLAVNVALSAVASFAGAFAVSEKVDKAFLVAAGYAAARAAAGALYAGITGKPVR